MSASTTIDDALLLTTSQAARRCGVSYVTWRRYSIAGLCPAPTRIGKKPMWSADELRRWIAAGTPGRDQWEQIKGV